MDTITRFEPTVSTFANRVVEAILPLVDPEDREQLREDVGDAEVYAAVKPIFADYTVEEAVSASLAIRKVMNDRAIGEPDRFEAAFEARMILEDFICKARASSPACATARVNFLLDGNDQTIGDDNRLCLYDALARDIECLRSGNFAAPAKKRRFGGAKWYEVD